MTLKFSQTDELVNTQYAPLAALLAHYQQNQVLQPLHQVVVPMKSCDFTPADKLQQVSIFLTKERFVSVLKEFSVSPESMIEPHRISSEKSSHNMR